MKLTYGNQTIDLFSKELFPETPKKVVVSLSGGLDSSGTSYFTAKKIGKINTYCVTENNKNYIDPEGIYSKRVSEIIQSKHKIFNYD